MTIRVGLNIQLAHEAEKVHRYLTCYLKRAINGQVAWEGEAGSAFHLASLLQSVGLS